nr:MAG TPA: hypothetical protein [Caudoviricetes sp.]
MVWRLESVSDPSAYSPVSVIFDKDGAIGFRNSDYKNFPGEFSRSQFILML